MGGDPKVSAQNEGVIGLLDKLEMAIYLLVALFLGIMALMTFFIVAMDLTEFIMGPADLSIIDIALNSLLVTLIIAALIQTVIVYIKVHTLDLRLILGVGLTAMIRRVLVFGVEKTITWEQMAVTALLIFVIILGVYLIDEKKPPES
ncbi:phosphate-starvation-inducible PsiE family protein [Methanocella conradii]|uniref:phosphate-starvation-inducible PsiE family protein n=1 Tax=Methanocella conradii TaxID=1175444 RepID=UPI0024B392B0|nr:phosphate-starvation-inducible PsiE family protein [Methanocella conradii]MDI6895868.1 phosphate-starvation-inducible PsiE family protein [Methanocella conradii]